MGYFSFPEGTVLSDKWKQISLTTTWKKENPLEFHLGFRGIIGTTWIKNIKVEKGSEATPWCPAKAEQTGDNIRIWAGASYNSRESAPFRVNQNGELFASKGTFSGKVVSEEVT